MDKLAIIHDETDRFIAAIQIADPGAPVPTCPDWNAEDLLWHFTDVHGFWAEILRAGAVSDEDVEAIEANKPARPADRTTTIAMLVERTRFLIDELAARSDSDAAWSWFPPDQTVGFTRRMQMHEATMHRVDAELTAGLDSAPIPDKVAADGIAHAIEGMWAWWGTNPGFDFVPVHGSIELNSTSGQQWLVQPGRWRGTGESGKAYDEPGVKLVESGTAVASITGTTEAIYRWLWGRGPEPETTGDRESLDALREVQGEGMP